MSYIYLGKKTRKNTCCFSEITSTLVTSSMFSCFTGLTKKPDLTSLGIVDPCVRSSYTMYSGFRFLFLVSLIKKNRQKFKKRLTSRV